MAQFRITTRKGWYRVEDRLDRESMWRMISFNRHDTLGAAIEELERARINDDLAQGEWTEVALPTDLNDLM